MLPVLLCVPTIAALLWVRYWFFARDYAHVGMQILIGLVPYAVGLTWAIRTKRVSNYGEFTVGTGKNEAEPFETYVTESRAVPPNEIR